MGLLALLVASVTARAQSTGSGGGLGVSNYRPPGLGVESPTDPHEALKGEVEESLWNLGGLRLDPWLGIGDVIVQQIGQGGGESELEDDVGVSAGAGLRGILPLGEKTYLSGEIAPSYVWWEENQDRNREQLSASLGFDLFLSRLRLHVEAGRQEALERPSPERQLFVSRGTDTVDAELEVEIAPALSVFGQGSHRERRSREDDVPELAFVSQDDRDEDILAYGLRWRPRENLVIGLGIEDLSLDFRDPTRDRSAEGQSPFLAVSLGGGRTTIQGRVVLRDLEPQPGSVFGGYDEPSGELAVQRQLGWRTGVELRASRDIFFAFDPGSSHFESDRLRGGVTFEVARAVGLRLFAGVGDDEYFASSTQIVTRTDDVTEWGAGLTWQIGPRVNLLLGYTLEDFDSDVESFDRDLDRLHFALSLSAFGGRLSVR